MAITDVIEDLEDIVYGCDTYDPKKVIEAIESALKLAPNNIKLYQCFSEVLTEHDMYERAVAINRIADQIAPNNLEHLLTYAWSLTLAFEKNKDPQYYPELLGVLERLQQKNIIDEEHKYLFDHLLDRMKQPWYLEQLHQA